MGRDDRLRIGWMGGGKGREERKGKREREEVETEFGGWFGGTKAERE